MHFPRNRLLALSFTTSPSLNRASSSLSTLSAFSRPMAPKKSMETTWARRLRKRATCVRRSRERLGLCIGAQRLRHGTCVLGHVVVVGVARLVEERPDLLIRKAVDQACLTDDRFTAAFDDLSQQPLEILLRLLVHRQRMHRVLDRDRAEVLQPPPDLDAEICRLRRKLMDEQEPAVDQRRMGSGIHGIDTVSSYWSRCNTCIISISRVQMRRPPLACV